MTIEAAQRTPVSREAKPDVLRRLAYIEGHLQGVRRMIEEDKYCVDVLKQTYAVRRAIEKLETLILENHLQGCVVQGIREGREDEVVGELVDLYELAGR
jgi:DNA-binding FrmR family transcriptional regulator